MTDDPKALVPPMPGDPEAIDKDLTITALKARVATLEDGSFFKRQGAILVAHRTERNEARAALASTAQAADEAERRIREDERRRYRPYLHHLGNCHAKRWPAGECNCGLKAATLGTESGEAA